MLIVKTDSGLEKRVQQVEALCAELKIRILYTYNGLCIQDTSNGAMFQLIDTEQNEKQTDFPRSFDNIRLLVRYLKKVD